MFIVGILLVLIVFLIMFCMVAHREGYLVALQIWGLGILFAILLGLGTHFIIKGLMI
jgi:hypothetical protein